MIFIELIICFALYFVTLLLIWQFVGYPILMALITLRSQADIKSSYLPSVSIIIPTYNEHSQIENRINNILQLDYPKDKYEIMVVDSGSTDGTAELVNYIKNEKELRTSLRLLNEEERNGKASAINFGKKNAKFDIILVTDANSKFSKNVLKEMMHHFKDPKVGAVGGRYCVENPDYAITQSESFYWDLERIMRTGESLIDSACLFHGEINAWRKNIVDADCNALSEDLDMCIQIRKKGYKIQYEPKAIVYEPSATTYDDQIKQRKRTCIGTIQAIFKHWKFFLFPKDIYSLVIMPSHKILTIVSPFLLITILICYILIGNINTILIHASLSIIAFIACLIVLLYLKSKFTIKFDGYDTKSGNMTLKMIPKIANYVLLNEYLIMLAWKSYLFKDYSVLWEKIESSRLN